MADEELSKELKDAVANQDKMTHVDTKATPSEVALKLKCQDCDEMQDFPMCEDDGIQMELSDDGAKLTCSNCPKEMETPKHHDKYMKPYIVKA